MKYNLISYLLVFVLFIFNLKVESNILPNVKTNSIYLTKFNSLQYQNKDSSINEKIYNELIDRVILQYKDIFPLYGAKGFNVYREWESDNVNAATRKRNGYFEMIVYGGLARFEPLTSDGMLLVLCHEIGHLIGGAPTFKPQNDGSAEGQADYYSTSKCFKKIIDQDDNKKIIDSKTFHSLVLEKCERVYGLDNKSYYGCLRTSKAIESLANTIRELSELDFTPDFDTPDPYQRMFILFNGYPSEQCRIDTVFAGSLCNKDFTELNDMNLYNKGNCSKVENYEIGLRPRCWYVERLDN